jgi:hypothetical protein
MKAMRESPEAWAFVDAAMLVVCSSHLQGNPPREASPRGPLGFPVRLLAKRADPAFMEFARKG